MKKRLFPALLAVFLLLGGCSRTTAEDDKLRILCTTYPVYLFTTAVTGGVEGVEVSLLVNSQTSCLHDYTLTVDDMKAIEAADVIVMNGAGLEDFMDGALSQSGAAVIDCSEKIDLLPLSEEHGREGHSHGEEYDPHFWMMEEGAIVMMSSIARGLDRLDEDNMDAYQANLAAAVAQLPDDPLSGVGLSCPCLITFHDGFQYFAHDNGLTLLKAIEEEEGSTASAAEIKEIVALIEEYDIPAIFVEKNGSRATAEVISRETGCEIYELDMLMSGEGSGIQPYLDAMNANYAAVREALQ